MFYMAVRENKVQLLPCYSGIQLINSTTLYGIMGYGDTLQ